MGVNFATTTEIVIDWLWHKLEDQQIYEQRLVDGCAWLN